MYTTDTTMTATNGNHQNLSKNGSLSIYITSGTGYYSRNGQGCQIKHKDGLYTMVELIDVLERFEQAEMLSINDLAQSISLDEARWAVDKLIEKGHINNAITKWHMGYAEIDHDAIQYKITMDGHEYLYSRKKLAQKVADDKADADTKSRANIAQIDLNQKKLFRHDFKVAAFTVILTLVFEHIGDIVNLIKRVADMVMAVFLK